MSGEEYKSGSSSFCSLVPLRPSYTRIIKGSTGMIVDGSGHDLIFELPQT
jgi:hypothetical protein